MAGSDYDVSKDVLLPKSHAGAYTKDTRFELVTAADPSQKSLRRFGRKWDVSNLYCDVEEMLAKESLDVLSIASSTDSHICVLKQALKSSVKVVLIEKPVSNSLAEVVSLLQDVAESGKAVIVFYKRRWNKNNILIKKWIREGVFGDVVKASMYYSKGLLHNGTHGIDLMRWYFGEFKNVMGITNVSVGGEDVVDACFTLGNDASFFAIGTTGRDWNIWELDILMEKGRIRFSLGGRKIDLMKPVEDPDFSGLKAFGFQDITFENDWHNSMSNTVDSIYNILECSAPVPCSYFDGVVALGWAVRAIESAKSGCESKSYVINGLRRL